MNSSPNTPILDHLCNDEAEAAEITEILGGFIEKRGNSYRFTSPEEHQQHAESRRAAKAELKQLEDVWRTARPSVRRRFLLSKILKVPLFSDLSSGMIGGTMSELRNVWHTVPARVQRRFVAEILAPLFDGGDR